MLPAVFQTLKASTAVKAIVGTQSPRIYRHGAAPPRDKDAPVVPYITWLLIAGTPEINLSDLPPFDRATVQVDCWHPTDSGVETLAEAVRDAIEPVANMTGVILDEREPETGLYRMSMQFDFFVGR